jgi:glutathionylspermidine amidase/synthetase
VTADYVRIAEQNVENSVWPAGRTYAREIPAETGEDGRYWLNCSFGDSTILGWVIQTDDDTHAERIEPPDPVLLNIQEREVAQRTDTGGTWLDLTKADEAAYAEFMRGHLLNSDPSLQRKYYRISETALAELRRATNELHALFMHATNYVLSEDSRLETFNIPRALWPKIHQSWDNRRNQMISGRFDFTLSERGLKVYEYNCDSASCHMEAGRIQGKWAEHFGCAEGTDPGASLHELLVGAWRHSDVNDVLHIMQDRDLEENYHALFMQSAMTAAGIKSKIIRGVSGLRWENDGGICDAEGVRVNWVWKTWAWETALDQLRAEFEDDEIRLRKYGRGRLPGHPPRLVDVLLRPEVMVYEPLWTLIPSNKAILPVLWTMFPEYPYLLNTSYELTEELSRTGYVVKPIVGRGGANISIIDRHEVLRAESGGQFENRDHVYQQLCLLPRIGPYNVQVSTFTAAGRYAGTCVRIDESDIISMESENLALRVVQDDQLKHGRG